MKNFETELPQDKLEDYIDSGAVGCVRCDSQDIFESDSLRMDDTHVWRTFACEECNTEWMEQYTVDAVFIGEE